jgi:D-alanyl-D-alanine carboxypeptidase
MLRPARLFASLLGVLLALPAGGNGLPDRPRAVIKQQLVPDEAVTVMVRDLLTGDELVAMNAKTPRTPASVMKVLPTFAALDMLGPAYTWKTRAYADGPIAKGMLQGDLYLKGGGDPLMTIERWWRFVTDLRQTGLRTIDGDVVNARATSTAGRGGPTTCCRTRFSSTCSLPSSSSAPTTRLARSTSPSTLSPPT